jgi:hypothetical protein
MIWVHFISVVGVPLVAVQKGFKPPPSHLLEIAPANLEDYDD